MGVKIDPELTGERHRLRHRERVLHALGEDGGLVVAIGDSDADRGGARPGGRARIHGDDHKLVDVVRPFVVQATGGADHAPRCDVEVGAVDEVRELRVHAGVAVPRQN